MNNSINDGVCLYDPSLKVPLIFRFPDGEEKGKRCSKLTQLVDIFPSLLDILEIQHSGNVDGQSLFLCQMETNAGEDARLAIFAIFKGEVAGNKSLLSVRSSLHKYILTSSWWGDRLLIPAQEEFYNLKNDPLEIHNFIAKYYWQRWQLSSKQKIGGLSKKGKEILRSLGYIN